jgi:hypothetical protein
MPSYSGYYLDPIAPQGVVPSNGGGPTRMIALRMFNSQTTTPIANRFIVGRESILAFGSTVSPSQENTRSPAATGTYGQPQSVINVTTILVFATMITTHHSWVPRAGCQPIVYGVSTTDEGMYISGISEWHVCFREDEIAKTTIRGRRCSRRGGLWWVGGNTICDHQKTGSGAYQFFAPRFDNDVQMFESSQWQKPEVQWNINLFGATTLRKSFAFMNGV